MSNSWSDTRLYMCWQAMKSRCYTRSNKDYWRYGGKGIQVCQEWRSDFGVFRQWAENFGYADDLTLDRKENDKDYTPDNCRWATRKEQSNNVQRNRRIVAFGESKTASQWARDPRCKTSLSGIFYRLNQGWDEERVLSQPNYRRN